MTSRAEKLLSEAKKYLASSETKQRASDNDKWEAAERMGTANREEGVSQNEIAKALGTHQSLVSDYIAMWERYQDHDSRPSFTEALYEQRPKTTPAATQERAAQTMLRSAPAKTVEKIVSALPPERQAVVARAAIRSSGDEVMADPQTRMRARAAAERQAGAARAQAESERRAHASALRTDTPDAVDGRALTELGGALGRIIGTTRAAAEIWKRWESKVSPEARDAAIDDIGNTQARVDTILDAMRGADLDAALTKILAETEETA
jgi:predicted transcriptional regulator